MVAQQNKIYSYKIKENIKPSRRTLAAAHSRPRPVLTVADAEAQHAADGPGRFQS